MKKWVITGVVLIGLFVFLAAPLFAIEEYVRKSRSSSMTTFSCIVDQIKIDESLTEAEKNALNGLSEESYRNNVVAIYQHKDGQSIDDLISKSNDIIEAIQTVELVSTKAVFIQAHIYGLEYIDYLKEANVHDISLEINQQFEEAQSQTFDAVAKSYYVDVQTDSMRKYCVSGVEGLPAQKPYTITGWFPTYNKDGSGGYHDGIDLGLTIGTPLFAITRAEVVLTGTGCANDGSLSNRCGGSGSNGMNGISGFGNFVILKIPDTKIYIAYAHLTAPLVKVGDIVEANQQIGLSGNSGKSTGPHLHFVISEGESMYDVINSTKVKNPCEIVMSLCE
ncbi:M23 family metallopeptidase [Erysipelothrix anatis]|uniref:M23 family metallopeptidase n=1 Tax=Erysipelothrix anatis TaxID=2683713 RepID=UPI00140A39D1|nr:M23 family metallopeptidase [Erysipelothrix anatis]